MGKGKYQGECENVILRHDYGDWQQTALARSLLSRCLNPPASKLMAGRLPDDPAVLEKEIDGVGRYTAGESMLSFSGTVC